MNKRMFRSVAAIAASSMMLTACVTNGNSPGSAISNPQTNSVDGRAEPPPAPTQPLTPEEQKLRDQADTFNGTMLEGALTGCVAGLLLGLLAAKSKNAAGGAIIGCAVGAGVGAGAGAYIADKQENYANTEQRYNSMIADVHKDNERLAGVIENSRTVIAADRARIEQVDKDLAAGKITMDQAKAKMAHVDQNTAYLQTTIDNLKKRQQTYAEALQQTKPTNGNQKAAMDKEITQLQKQIASLEADRNALVDRRKISRVG